jgi:hypothetical protein
MMFIGAYLCLLICSDASYTMYNAGNTHSVENQGKEAYLELRIDRKSKLAIF